MNALVQPSLKQYAHRWAIVAAQFAQNQPYVNLLY